MIQEIRNFIGNRPVFFSSIACALFFTLIVIVLHAINPVFGYLYLFIMLFEIIYFIIKYIIFVDGEYKCIMLMK